MGDCCSLQITLRRQDLEAFGKAIGYHNPCTWWDELYHEDNPAVVTVSVYEANYGWLDYRIAAAEAGITFTGQHESGGGYGPCVFAAVRGLHIEMPVDHDGNLVMALDDELNPITTLEDLRAFIDHKKAAEEILYQYLEGDDHADGSAEDRDAALLRTA